MNNLALQKLIHFYQDPKIEYKTAFAGHWKKEHTGLEVQDLVPHWKSVSDAVQGSSKFYIDHRDNENSLTFSETTKLLEDMKLYSPYDRFLIQVEYDDMVDHIHILNTISDSEGEADDQIIASRYVYHKKADLFSYDYNSYHFIREPKNEEEVFPFSVIMQNEAIKDCVHIDRLPAWVEPILHAYTYLNIHLQFPEISEQKDVKGRPNTTIGHRKLRKHTRSELRSLPSYEHKTLVLNMYDNDTGNGASDGRSKGTAFHSVRKHIRKYKDGKTTFVKAHFRGSKDVGIVSKDYKIAGGAE